MGPLLEAPRWAMPSDEEDQNPVDDARRPLDPRKQEATRLLIVEDDFLIAMEAEAALSEAGFSVLDVASTAEEAFALARQHQPEVVVMDIRLAGQRDGIDAAGDLYRELGLRCIFATAHDDQLTRARAEPYGPLGWLTKPYTMASLVRLVRAALSKPN
jgi:DNA-binding NarL/FixJ family response regulator